MRPVATTLKQVGKKYRLISDETGGVLHQMGPRKLSEARATYRKERLAGEDPEPVETKYTVTYTDASTVLETREFSEGDHITFPDVEGFSGHWDTVYDDQNYSYWWNSQTWDPEELLMPAEDLTFDLQKEK